MRVRILDEGERYPLLKVEVQELATGDPAIKQYPNVPPELINALQKAERELAKAQHAILLHLSLSKQFRVYAPYDQKTRRRNPEDDILFYSLEEHEVESQLTRLSDDLGEPFSKGGS